MPFPHSCAKFNLMLPKKFLEEQKKKLEKEKIGLEKELGSFAKKDPQIKGNWETKFPDFGIQTADLSQETDQSEEYAADLPVEYALETRLQRINSALERIHKGTYGTCQNCKQRITIERLKAEPEAELCIKCTRGGV